ncbi:MAG: hypothetical protein QG635_1419 [Bacteroidota bacterium]|nr:hypothetical protein [Bacteroidota bacterium]
MKNTTITLIAILCFFLGFALSYYLFPQYREISKPLIIEKRVIDTVIKSIPQEPLIINKVKTKIEYKHDTIIITKPFMAHLDTIICHDTVRAEYEFPANEFSLLIRKKPDTSRVERITVYSTIDKNTSWWQEALYFVSGSIIGILISNGVK